MRNSGARGADDAGDWRHELPGVLSVNVGTPVTASWAGQQAPYLHPQAQRGRPGPGPRLGLEGDQVADTKHHGGVFQAVYAFAQEDLDLWAARIGGPLGPAMFGENLTTAGLDVNEAVLGEQLADRHRPALAVEVRIPCSVFKNWLGRHHLDNAEWAKRFTAEGRPGPYLRVLEEGVLQAGDEIVVEHRPEHGVHGLDDVPGADDRRVVAARAARRTAVAGAGLRAGAGKRTALRRGLTRRGESAR